jgi:hypothetical protein
MAMAIPACDSPIQALGLAVCGKCAVTPATVQAKAIQALRGIWPDLRAETVTHPAGGPGMNRAHRRQAKPRHPPIPATWGEVLERCPFRSLIGIGQPRDANGMMERIAHTFAALGGETTPIADDLLDEMATSIRARGVVLLISDRADLRDAAKREILARAHGAAECA